MPRMSMGHLKMGSGSRRSSQVREKKKPKIKKYPVSGKELKGLKRKNRPLSD